MVTVELLFRQVKQSMHTTGNIIGVLALQGAFREHRRSLDRLGAESREVRLPGQLEGLAGLIIPGGESVAIGKLLVEWKLLDPIREMGLSGMPVWGTCAGAILMAHGVEERGRIMNQPVLDLLPMVANRNAFGRQRESFETDLSIKGFEEPYRAVFIRSPLLATGDPSLEVLAEVDGEAVFVRRNNLMATSFHPELTDDIRIHRLFLTLVAA